MTTSEWARVRRVFEAALDRPVPERVAFLDVECAGDPALRAEVASLLDAHETAGDFIEAPAYQAAADLFAEDEPESLAGRQIGPYVIRHELGRGGMGVVYLADDIRLSRRVALKALFPGVLPDAGRRARIRLEARAAAALSHPGIATVYALEEIDGDLYVAFEYVAGPTLRALIGSGSLTLLQVVDIAAQLARALAAAHAQGIVHRDLKPENVIRTPSGVTKVLDFGIARVADASGARLTRSGAAMGTPAYMSPEQVRGEETDFRTDVFSLGVIIRELASGGAGSPSLDAIASRCLQVRAADRYASTESLAADLERLRSELSAGRDPQPAGASGPTPRWWWEAHQLIASAVYALMLYPAWRSRPWLPRPLGSIFFFVLLACSAGAATMRLHLWFTSRFYPGELTAQRSRLSAWTRATDVGFSATLFLAAFGLGEAHPEIATLFVATSIVAAAASFIIEPATTTATFRGGSR